MLDPLIVNKLLDRYPELHPLLFHRSVERARSNGDLFDILDTLPKYPMIWCEDTYRWVTAKDLYLAEDFLNQAFTNPAE